MSSFAGPLVPLFWTSGEVCFLSNCKTKDLMSLLVKNPVLHTSAGVTVLLCFY